MIEPMPAPTASLSSIAPLSADEGILQVPHETDTDGRIDVDDGSPGATQPNNPSSTRLLIERFNSSLLEVMLGGLNKKEF